MRVYRFEEPVQDSLAPSRSKGKKPRRRWPLVTALVVVVVLAAVAGGALYLGRDTGSTIPIGTQIDGVDVGDLTAAEAKAKVRAHGQELVARGVEVVAGGNRFAIDPAAINLRPNAQAAVVIAQDDSAFLQRLQGRLGLGTARQVPLTYLYNPSALMQALLPVRQATTVAPRNAVVVEDDKGRFPVQPAADGRRPSISGIRQALRSIGSTGPEIPV